MGKNFYFLKSHLPENLWASCSGPGHSLPCFQHMHFPWAHTGVAPLWVCRTRVHKLGPAAQDWGSRTSPSCTPRHTKLCLLPVTQPAILQKPLSAQLSLLQWENFFHFWGDQACPEGMAGAGCRVPGASRSQFSPMAAAQPPPASFVCHPGRPKPLSCSHPRP